MARSTRAFSYPPDEGWRARRDRAENRPNVSALALDPPLSPELVLVSPPEVAALARERLPDPPAFEARTAAGRARTAAVVAFSTFCVATCLTPFVLSAVAAG
jgi:hypothetical protein